MGRAAARRQATRRCASASRRLRKALGPGGELLVTQPPGYALRIQPAQLDLSRFEQLVADGERALGAGDPERAVELLGEALGLWRGAPLADLPYAPFAQAPVVRLEELRLAALELRIDAELALGHHRRLAAELQELVAEHPLRERLWGQLMLALYHDGRQADALAAYSIARTRLVEEIGIEPGPPLQELQRRILAQDPALASQSRSRRHRRGRSSPSRAMMAAIDPLAEIALRPRRRTRLRGRGRRAGARRGRTGRREQRPERRSHGSVGARFTRRAAAFTSADAGGDALRLVTEQDVALLLLDAPADLLETGRPARPGRDHGGGGVRRRARRAWRGATGGAVLVPFAGHEHDWAAIELGAWLAAAHAVPLRLVGVEAGARRPRRKPPAGQRLAGAAAGMGVAAESALVPVGADGVLAAARGASALVVGLSERWEREGLLGETRRTLARRAQPPVLFVRRGLRPGGMAPPAALTRFTWSGVRG